MSNYMKLTGIFKSMCAAVMVCMAVLCLSESASAQGIIEPPKPTRQTTPAPAKRKPTSGTANPIRTVPRNLDLQMMRDGNRYYIGQREYKSLNAEVKSQYEPVGVVVIKGKVRIVVALHDNHKGITWGEAMEQYGSRVPSYDQARAIADQSEAINKAIIAYGGDSEPADWYWTSSKTETSSSIWVLVTAGGFIELQSPDRRNRVRTVTPLP